MVFLWTVEKSTVEKELRIYTVSKGAKLIKIDQGVSELWSKIKSQVFVANSVTHPYCMISTKLATIK